MHVFLLKVYRIPTNVVPTSQTTKNFILNNIDEMFSVHEVPACIVSINYMATVIRLLFCFIVRYLLCCDVKSSSVYMC